MKNIIGFVLFCLMPILGFSQDTYMAGIITGFDINVTGSDRPVDIVKLKGYIILDNNELVIQTKNKRKEWVQAFEVDTIIVHGKNDAYSTYEISCKNYQDNPFIASLKIFDDQTWTIAYDDGETKWNFAGLALKKWLIDQKY